MPNLSLIIEGWRGINHSFALVNQFQLLELVKRSDVQFQHRDASFHLPHWSKAINGAGFHADDDATLDGLHTDHLSSGSDWVYRIFSPVNPQLPANGARLALFAVTECGIDSRFFATEIDRDGFTSAGGFIATPSEWSRHLIVESGFNPETVHVVPHGVNKDYFFPRSEEVNLSQRRALGFRDDEVILLNIGAPMWNKGIDTLIKGFAIARQSRPDLRLVFKDQRNTYGISSEEYVQSTLSAAGLRSTEVLNAITLIPANLTMDQMNSIYGVSDCYVSPYRAEGFNLPVCEAMACGVPVIVTDGGATDDFVRGSAHTKIESKLYTNALVQNRLVAAYREPDLNHFVGALVKVTPKSRLDANKTDSFQTMDWSSPVDKLIRLMQSDR